MTQKYQITIKVPECLLSVSIPIVPGLGPNVGHTLSSSTLEYDLLTLPQLPHLHKDIALQFQSYCKAGKSSCL